MNIQDATAEVLWAAGWDQLARDVRRGAVSPAQAIKFALRMPGRFESELERAQALVAEAAK